MKPRILFAAAAILSVCSCTKTDNRPGLSDTKALNIPAMEQSGFSDGDGIGLYLTYSAAVKTVLHFPMSVIWTISCSSRQEISSHRLRQFIIRKIPGSSTTYTPISPIGRIVSLQALLSLKSA